MRNFLLKKCLIAITSLLVLNSLISCNSSHDKDVHEVVSNYIQACKDGDFEVFRKYCCGMARENFLDNLILYVSAVEPVAIAAEENGEGDYASLMNRAMDRYVEKQCSKYKKGVENVIVNEKVTAYPNHENDCKMVDLIIDNDTVTYFIHKSDGKWLISYFMEKEILPSVDEEFYASKILPKKDDKKTYLYNLDTKLTWRNIEKYFK